MRNLQLSIRLAAAAGLGACAAAGAQTDNAVRLPCVADTNVSSYPSERGYNYGGSSHIRLKGIEMLMLAKFDTAPIAGKKIARASLFLHAGGAHKLRTIGLSTVAVDWVEGEGNGAAAKSGATFEWADVGKRHWGGRQSDVTDATFSRQGTRAWYADAVVRPNGWLEVDVPPQLVGAMRDGVSHGMAISDEKGQTYFNNDVHSREQSGFAPYLEVTTAPGAPEIPAAETRLPPSTVRPQPAPLSAAAAPQFAGGEPPAHNGLRVWALGDCEKAHPVSGNLLEEVGEKAIAGPDAGEYRKRNAVWDGATSTIHLAGARNEFVAFQLCVEAAGGASGVRVSADDLVGPQGAKIPGGAVRWFQDWYVRDGEWYPEVARPLRDSFAIPDPQNQVPGQRNQSVLGEIYVPHDLPAGLYHGAVQVSASGVAAFRLPVELRVWSFALPDRLSFDIDLNAYGPPGDAAKELLFHRMAHEHRATLNILGYYQSGQPNEAYVPLLEGSGKTLHVRDWSAWDRRFGRYFDGTAFADLPRAKQPLGHAYLPFCEGWPSDIRKHYHYTPTVTSYPEIIAEHALKAPPVEQAFDTEYQDEFRAIVREFARHFREKGWNDTEFQFYLNDKYYFRDPKQGGRGSSWWLLDEPMHRDDWMALRFFGKMFQESVRETLPGDGPKPKMLFRADISRPQWQRDWLDGLVNLMCVSGEFFRKNELCMDMRDRQHETFWHYGTGNDIRATNLTGEAWALKVYLAGGDGLLPWDSLGGDESYLRPTPTTILYPGQRFGIGDPVASLRLKAFRRGQQDVEYLALLAMQRNWSREQLAAAVAPLVDLRGKTRERFVDDAGTPLFENLSTEQFARIRSSVAAALEGGQK